MNDNHSTFEILPFPSIREASIDLLRAAKGKHMITGFTEADVTLPRQIIREHKARTGERLSFTAFLVGCMAAAVAENKAVNAYRRGKRRIVRFNDVDVNTMVEREVGGQRMGTPNVIRAADKKTYRQIHDQIRAAQAGKVEETRGMEWFRWASLFGRLPTFVRMAVWRALMRNPHAVKRFAGTVGLTPVGMFGKRAGWGITIPFLTINVVVGGISQKPVLVDGQLENREFLCLTISFDHEIVEVLPSGMVDNSEDLPERPYAACGAAFDSRQQALGQVPSAAIGPFGPRFQFPRKLNNRLRKRVADELFDCPAVSSDSNGHRWCSFAVALR